MFSKLRFGKPKIFVSIRVFGEIHLTQIFWNFKTSCCNLTIKVLGAKVCIGFSVIPNERNYDVLKSKSLWFPLDKNINSNKNETEWKIENPTTLLKRRILCFSSYENRGLKIKLWWVHERKKITFFVTFILSEGDFFNICVLSQCIVCWIKFQNIHTFAY